MKMTIIATAGAAPTMREVLIVSREPIHMGNGDIRIRATPNDARVATPAVERIREFEARKYDLPRRVDERGRGGESA